MKAGRFWAGRQLRGVRGLLVGVGIWGVGTGRDGAGADAAGKAGSFGWGDRAAVVIHGEGGAWTGVGCKGG